MKTVLITGGARGIGRAAAIKFAKEGFNVAINYNKSERAAHELSEELCSFGISAESFHADVSDINQVDKMCRLIESHLGTIDILVNNAGISEQKLFTDITYQDWARMINVNLTGVFNCCSKAVPMMLSKQSGSIVNVSSIWGVSGGACEVHYSAAKAGVIGFTKALAKELALSGIRVNCVAPGAVQTDMCKEISKDNMQAFIDETPMGRMGTPDEIAEGIFFLASDKAGFITGHVLNVNGGYLV